MNKDQVAIIELLIRKSALKDVEIWLNEQYVIIDQAIREVEETK